MLYSNYERSLRVQRFIYNAAPISVMPISQTAGRCPGSTIRKLTCMTLFASFLAEHSAPSSPFSYRSHSRPADSTSQAEELNRKLFIHSALLMAAAIRTFTSLDRLRAVAMAVHAARPKAGSNCRFQNGGAWLLSVIIPQPWSSFLVENLELSELWKRWVWKKSRAPCRNPLKKQRCYNLEV